MKVLDWKTKTYQDGDWLLDIVEETTETSRCVCGYIYHKDFGVKELLFGLEDKWEFAEKLILEEFTDPDTRYFYLEQHT